MRAAVECHVLDEVRETELVVRFVQRARLDGQTEGDAFLGTRVPADEVGQAVRQRPAPHRLVKRDDILRIERGRRRLRRLRRRGRSAEERREKSGTQDEKLSHRAGYYAVFTGEVVRQIGTCVRALCSVLTRRPF